MRDFDRSTRDSFVQAVDKITGLLLWSAMVHNSDPDVRKNDKTVDIKFAVEHQPVPPPMVAETPFRPVEFEGLAVTPTSMTRPASPLGPGCRARIAYSLRAVGMRAPQKGPPGVRPDAV